MDVIIECLHTFKNEFSNLKSKLLYQYCVSVFFNSFIFLNLLGEI